MEEESKKPSVDKFQPGDKVRFRPEEKIPSYGIYTVSHVQDDFFVFLEESPSPSMWYSTLILMRADERAR